MQAAGSLDALAVDPAALRCQEHRHPRTDVVGSVVWAHVVEVENPAVAVVLLCATRARRRQLELAHVTMHGDDRRYAAGAMSATRGRPPLIRPSMKTGPAGSRLSQFVHRVAARL